MSQRVEYVNQDITVNLSVKVKLKSFSNHNGFRQGQIDLAIEEFKEMIARELFYKIEREFYDDNMLSTVDSVSYEVTKLED